MKSRALRFALATLFVGVLGGAAYVMWSEETEGRSASAASRQFDERTRTVTRALLDVKSAQPGYVGAGQGDDFWTTRVDALLGASREGLATLRPQARTSQAQTEIDAAAAAFDDFEQMDRRARDYVRNGQRLLASDLIFSDGIEKIDAAVTAIERARTAEVATTDVDLQQRERKQWIAAGGAAALGLLTLALLIPLPREAAGSGPPRQRHLRAGRGFPDCAARDHRACTHPGNRSARSRQRADGSSAAQGRFHRCGVALLPAREGRRHTRAASGAGTGVEAVACLGDRDLGGGSGWSRTDAGDRSRLSAEHGGAHGHHRPRRRERDRCRVSHRPRPDRQG